MFARQVVDVASRYRDLELGAGELSTLFGICSSIGRGIEDTAAGHYSPTGAVQQVNCLTTTTDAAGNKDSRTFSPVEPIYLLVGKDQPSQYARELPPPNPIPTD